MRLQTVNRKVDWLGDVVVFVRTAIYVGVAAQFKGVDVFIVIAEREVVKNVVLSGLVSGNLRQSGLHAGAQQQTHRWCSDRDLSSGFNETPTCVLRCVFNRYFYLLGLISHVDLHVFCAVVGATKQKKHDSCQFKKSCIFNNLIRSSSTYCKIIRHLCWQQASLNNTMDAYCPLFSEALRTSKYVKKDDEALGS
jgi:hypothetical protein